MTDPNLVSWIETGLNLTQSFCGPVKGIYAGIKTAVPKRGNTPYLKGPFKLSIDGKGPVPDRPRERTANLAPKENAGREERSRSK
jgi:hypothetical protein